VVSHSSLGVRSVGDERESGTLGGGGLSRTYNPAQSTGAGRNTGNKIREMDRFSKLVSRNASSVFFDI